MTQNRDAPAFQEYAAAMMARIEYRVMSLEGRGLLYTVKLECWVNGTLPADAPTLARVLSYPEEQIIHRLPELGPFIAIEEGVIRCPELDDYRAHLEQRREKQSAGGRTGAAITNGKRGRRNASHSPARPRGGRESLVQVSPVQASKVKSLEREAIDKAWVNEYERASKGY